MFCQRGAGCFNRNYRPLDINRNGLSERVISSRLLTTGIMAEEWCMNTRIREEVVLTDRRLSVY